VDFIPLAYGYDIKGIKLDSAIFGDSILIFAFEDSPLQNKDLCIKYNTILTAALAFIFIFYGHIMCKLRSTVVPPRTTCQVYYSPHFSEAWIK